MELKSKIEKPYSNELKQRFIVAFNHKQGYEIKETESSLEAWGYSEEELEQLEKEKIAKLKLTRGDVFRGLLQAKGITRSQIKEMINKMPTNSKEEIFVKEMALIDFEEAQDFYRGNKLIDTIGLQLGITPEQLNDFFKTNNYKSLI